MRILILIAIVVLPFFGMAQEANEWTALESGVEYLLVSKKKVKNTEYAILKLKIRNTSEKTQTVQFTLFEYAGVLVKAKSQEEKFCLKPGFMDVVKIQMLDSSDPLKEESNTLEFTDLLIEEVESCK